MCDDVDPVSQHRYSSYTDMFKTGLNIARHNSELVPIKCFEGEPLPSVEDYQGYIISGSRYGVYEDILWIRELLQFVQACWDRDARVVGICFGHQLIAHALGGRTEKAAAGWAFGIQSATITHRQPWMTDYETLEGDTYSLVVIHQDQVVQMPPMFVTIAHNDFCPNSMIVADQKMLGIQGHPEFSRDYCKFRADFRRDIIGPDVYASAIHSLEQNSLHSSTILEWINNFLLAQT